MPSEFPFLLPTDSDFIDSPIHDLNVVQEAIDRLVQQYKTGNTEALIGAVATPAQDLEDALIQVYTQRWIATAVGAQLDVLGAIVGQDRGGFDDTTYRLFIQTRIQVNKSSGCPEELYAIFAPLLPAGVTQSLIYYAPAAFVLFFGGAALADGLATIFADFMRSARAGGVNGQIVWSHLAPSATFTLDGSSGQALDNGGLAEASA
jgi:cellobiose-specific phosphotransferase system component IIC